MNNSATKTIITLGTGQLGLMLGKAAKQLGIPFQALSIDDAWQLVENLSTPEDYLLTFEQEHVDPNLLAAFEKKHIGCFPSWSAFTVLRNKLSQKEFLSKHQIPTTPFFAELEAAKKFVAKEKGGVLKAGHGGYDGKGVWLLDANGEAQGEALTAIWGRIKSPYVEAKVPYDFELAAVVCRSSSGEVVLYPTVKSIQDRGICSEVEYTEEFARSALAKEAGAIAQKIAEKLEYVGVLAVELFAVGDKLFVNEIAPRVHNSGHFTIDVCAGSQFENHLRAGLGWPLKDTTPTHPAALMVNLLWPEHQTEFAPLFARLTCGPEWPAQAKLHWYGKSEARPRRKMGHFTVYGSTMAECKKIAQQILASRWA
jgi:5-(carboxyamino)imidazole ribonucleotide synthase